MVPGMSTQNMTAPMPLTATKAAEDTRAIATPALDQHSISIGAGRQLCLGDDVVRRGPNRVVRRYDVVPCLHVAALAGNDEHRRRTLALAVQEQLSAVTDVE